MKKASVITSLVAVIVIAISGPAHAHAVLIATDPPAGSVLEASPEAVTATFNERVEVAFGAMRVFDTNGTRVDEDDAGHGEGAGDTVRVGLRPDLPEGTYTVTYRVVSADSHPVTGAFVFHVAEPGAQPEGIASQLLGDNERPAVQIAYGVSRWLNFTGLILLAGSMAFFLLIWRATTSGGPDEMESEATRRVLRLVRWSFLVVVLATIASYVLQGAIVGEVGVFEAMRPTTMSQLAETRFGMVSIVKAALLALGGFTWWLVAAEAFRDRRETSLSLPVGGGLWLVALLATPGWAGHAGSTDPVWLNMTADVGHVAAAAVWMGGLVSLIYVTFPSTRSLETDVRTGVLAPVVSRFSNSALWAVGVLVVTGIYRSFVEVQAWRGFTDTSYGRVLLVKIIAFLPILILGAVNNRTIKPKLSDPPTGARGQALLKRLVTVEVILGAVVIALTALLVNLAPARVEAGLSGPFIADVVVEENTLNVLVDPNEIGENIVHLTLSDANGMPVEVANMEIAFRMPANEIGPIRTEGRQLGPGHYVVQGRELSIPGDWELEIEITFDRFTSRIVTIEVPVNG